MNNLNNFCSAYYFMFYCKTTRAFYVHKRFAQKTEQPSLQT